MGCDVKVTVDGVAVISLQGALNMFSAVHMREVVSSAISDGNIRIVVDLSELSSIDSSGIGALISGLKSARQAGGDLRITSPSDQVKLVLHLTNVDRVLTAYDSPDTAFSDE